MNSLRVILASASPRRTALLKQLIPQFTVIASDATEILREQLTAGELARANAWRKADSVAKVNPEALVLGADTVVYLDACSLGKPKDLAEARQMLRQLQGRTHQVITGVCLIHRQSCRRSIFVEATDVTFRALTPKQIDRYLDSIDPLDKAGGYAIQEGGDSIVKSISGSYSNVVGLPLERLRLELADWRL
jgi:septum formation protein